MIELIVELEPPDPAKAGADLWTMWREQAAAKKAAQEKADAAIAAAAMEALEKVSSRFFLSVFLRDDRNMVEHGARPCPATGWLGVTSV
jgi:hypothetical protein